MFLKKHVLTGGPCTGKTTMVNTLFNIGYQIIIEAAREIIEEQITAGGNLLPWINRTAFQNEILRRQLARESQLKTGDVFLDEGIHDGIAYFHLDGLLPPDELVIAAKNSNYNNVFLLDPLPEYEIDLARYHTKETAHKIHLMKKTVYKQYGYNLKCVPVLPINERVKWILHNL